MTQVRYLPAAQADVRRLFDFLVAKNRGAARRAVVTIRDSADSLTEAPWIGKPMGDETGRRELVVPFGAGAYVIRYRVVSDNVVIVRVWHTRELRRPT